MDVDGEKMIWAMRIMRGLSATVEVVAALLFLRMNDAGSILRINSLLGLVGPFIFISVSAFGIAASVNTIPLKKILLILGGVLLVIWGTKS